MIIIVRICSCLSLGMWCSDNAKAHGKMVLLIVFKKRDALSVTVMEELEILGKMQTVKITALQRSSKILWRVLKIWLVCFCGISNIVGKSISNPLYTYIKISMICKHIFLATFLTNLSPFFCTQLNGSKYFRVSQTIPLNISQLFTHI